MTPKNLKPLLLTPGPTPLPDAVMEELSKPITYHRTGEFRKVLQDVSEKMKKIFRTVSPIYTITSSGTGAMEASMVNFLSPGDEVLVAHAGKFGERWLQIAKAYGYKIHEVKTAYGKAISPASVENTLKQNRNIKAVYTTLCETSTGVTHDIQSFARIISKTQAILAVDAISGLAADPIEQDVWGVDVIVTGSQKALMVPPGLSLISVNAKANALSKSAKSPRYYLDLALYEKNLANWDTPFTPALTFVLALRRSVDLILARGMENIWKDCGVLAHAVRQTMKELNLELFAEERPSQVVTSVKVPQGIDGGIFIKTIREKFAITIAGGQGEMKGKIFRIAHMGAITKNDLERGISAVCDVLNQMNHRCDEARALRVFKEESKKVSV